MLYSTNWMLQELHENMLLKIEFTNVGNPKIHVFRCIDGTIGQGEIGDGWIYNFDAEKFKEDEWHKHNKT